MSGFSVSAPDQKQISFSFSRQSDNVYNKPTYYIGNSNAYKIPYGFVGQGGGDQSRGNAFRPSSVRVDLTDISPETKQFTLYPPRIIKDASGRPITSIDGKQLIDPGTIHKRILDKKPKKKGKNLIDPRPHIADDPNQLWYKDRHHKDENPLAPPNTVEAFFGSNYNNLNNTEREEISF